MPPHPFRRAALAGLAGGLLIAALAPIPAGGQFGGPAPVGVTEARQASVRPTVSLTGTVASRRSTVVASEVPGLVVELAAREGDAVKRGAVLVRLRRENLARRLDAARAQLREATARRDLATGSRARAEELFASGVISSQEYAAAVSEADAWQGRVEQTEADIARLADDLERSTIRAPFSGVVVAEHCQVGAWIAVGGPVVELIDLAALEVVLDVPEQHFAGLRTGLPARVRFAALSGLEVEGEVAAVIPRADLQARTFPVKVGLDNPEGKIGVGMLATVALPTGAPRPAVVVPKDAIVRQGPRRLVYVVEPAGPGGGPGGGGPANGSGGGGAGDGGGEVARAVEVELGAGVGVWIEARGVEAGARVVTRGNERLMPGAPVRAEPIAYPEP